MEWARFILAGILGALSSGDAAAHGALHEQIAELKTQLAKNPESANLYFRLAQVCCSHGEWDETLQAAARVEQLAPRRFPTDGLVGEALFGERKFAKAKAALDRLLTDQSENASALLTRARVHRSLNEEALSLADYRAVFRLTTSLDRTLPLEVAGALSSAGQREEGLQVLDKAIEKLGPVPALLTRALDLDLSLHRYDSALARVAVLQEKSVRPEPWMLRRVHLLAEAGRLVEARGSAETLQRTLDALPNLDRGLPAVRQVSEELRQLFLTFDQPPETSSALPLPGSPP